MNAQQIYLETGNLFVELLTAEPLRGNSSTLVCSVRFVPHFFKPFTNKPERYS